jgi:hypothetical protein
MKGKIILDWSKVNWNNPEDVKKVGGAFQAFLVAPMRDPVLRSAYKAFTTKGDFPTEVLQILEKYHATTSFDTGYEEIFDIRDFTATRESGFEIADVSSGLAFAKLLPGEKAEVYKMAGSKVSVSFDKYGGALQWDRTWIDDNKYWMLEDTTIEFRNKAYSSRAANFYALIDALSSAVNVAWQNPTPSTLANTNADYTVSRDINTIQYACDAILTDLKDKGYGVNANTLFKILAPNTLRHRINKALTYLNQAYQGSSRALTYNIVPVYTLMLSATDKYYVTVPGIKSKGGYRMDLTLLNFQEVLAYTEGVVGIQRYGGAIGDTEQWKRCSIA